LPLIRKYKRYGLALILALAALVIAGAVFYSLISPKKGRVLEIRDAASARVYGRWPLGESGEFSIEFVHSVHQSPVRETFRVEGSSVLPLAARFYSFGAGMQSDLEEGQTMSRDGDAMLVRGFNASFRELNYIVGTVSDHLLIIGDEAVSLRELCGRNASITIRPAKRRFKGALSNSCPRRDIL
jgi:hypothetical protein